MCVVRGTGRGRVVPGPPLTRSSSPPRFPRPQCLPSSLFIPRSRVPSLSSNPCISSSLQIPVARSPPLSRPAVLLQPPQFCRSRLAPRESERKSARESKEERQREREMERKAPSCRRLSRSVAFAICATPHNSVRARDALVFSPCVPTTPHDSTSCAPLP